MIDLDDDAHTAAQRGWGAGWPSCDGAGVAGLAVVRGPVSGVGVSVHRRLARLVALLIAATEERGYLLRAGECWGYVCRAIAGTSAPGHHSWGLAVDINALSNPYRFPRCTDLPTWTPLLWNRYGFAWGGNDNEDGQNGKADSMHFEFMGTPADADAMTALALFELTGPLAESVSASRRKDDPVAVIPINLGSDGTFRSAVMAEAGGDSIVVARAWITVASTWGRTAYTVTALDGVGRPMTQQRFDVPNNATRVMELPSGCKLVTLEGKADPNAIPAAALISLNR
ncbi:MAG TPA: M15 family metallopeptidase [Pseudonocardia sp.]